MRTAIKHLKILYIWLVTLLGDCNSVSFVVCIFGYRLFTKLLFLIGQLYFLYYNSKIKT
jgi:hypothetical protein